jgi:putative ABC transport system substrate-binding protein
MGAKWLELLSAIAPRLTRIAVAFNSRTTPGAALFARSAEAAAGGLASYGIDRAAQVRQAAAYVDRILRGARVNDLPVERASKFELVINLKAAKALGLTIRPRVLAMADAIIE